MTGRKTKRKDATGTMLMSGHDNATMFTSGEVLVYSCGSLPSNLNAASDWPKVWGMLYNVAKSQHLTVQSKHKINVS